MWRHLAKSAHHRGLMLLPVLSRFGVLDFALMAGFMLVCIARTSHALDLPVLFAEDGKWLGIAFSHGWGELYLNAKVGYYVILNIFLLNIASLAASLSGGGGFVSLPVWVALVSYGFYGFCAWIIFKATPRDMGPVPRVLAALAVCLVPLGWSASEVYGRLLNAGYILAPLCVALPFFQARVRAVGKTAIDVLIVASIFTNPAAFFGAVIGAVGVHGQSLLGGKLPGRSFFIRMGLYTLALVVVFATSKANTRFDEVAINMASLIEVALARSIAFPVIFPFYQSMNDVWAVIVCVLIAACIGYNGMQRDRSALTFYGLAFFAAAIMVTLITLYARPNLTHGLGDYLKTFPDRYFLAPNLSVLIALVATFADMIRRRGRVAWVGVGAASLLGLVYLTALPALIEGRNTRYKIARGPVHKELLCQKAGVAHTTNRRLMVVPIYPEEWVMQVPRAMVVEALRHAGCPDLPAEIVQTRLGDLPSQWGRSEAMFASFVESGPGLALGVVATKDVRVSEPEPISGPEPIWEVSGPDPYWVVSSDRAIDTARFSLLELRITCHSGAGAVPVKIFWHARNGEFHKSRSLDFTLTHRVNLVPLDTAPGWLATGQVTRLRLDIGSGDRVCHRLQLDDIRLHQRKSAP